MRPLGRVILVTAIFCLSHNTEETKMADPNLQDMQQMISAAFSTAARELENFQKKAKESTGSSGGVSQLNSMLSTMSKNLVGPVGVAANLEDSRRLIPDPIVGYPTAGTE